MKTHFFLFLLIVSNMLYSQEMSVDTTAFYKAQQKIDSCKSGQMIFRLNNITSQYEDHCELDLYFIKNDENKINYCMIIYDETQVREIVFYNDTLIFLNNDAYFKGYTKKPIENGVNNLYTFLIEGHPKLKNILSYNKIRIYDSISSVNQNEIKIVGKGSTIMIDTVNDFTADVDTKIVLNRNTNNIESYCEDIILKSNGAPIHKIFQEFIIDTIYLYKEKKQDIEDEIKIKYHELDSIVATNLENRKRIGNTCAPSK